ncbi:acetyl-CoA carboxylase biotin carboxyl carrier protein [Paraburkholderia sp. JPY465]|uniref:acetyl-CoA carboxylase biotin carboxyl carrier protein n=1 Tax=Paraburkholderia sp. JPY465 TaxID=3042285 RepID=UPI003D1E60E4
MDHDKLKRLLQMLQSTAVRELEFEEGDLKIKLTRNSVSDPTAVGTAAAAVTANQSGVVCAPTVEQPSRQTHMIAAGLTGTFYRAPVPDQAPFVAVGDSVAEGQTLAVVEAMKLLNAIEADRAGRIVSILAEDGATVSPDTELFAIEPHEVPHV